MGIGAATTGVPDPTGELSQKAKDEDQENIDAAIAAGGGNQQYVSPYEAMMQQQIAGMVNPEKLSEDPTALAFLSSRVGQETSKYLQDRAGAAASQGRAGGGVAAEGRFEAMRHDALQRGAAIAALKEKDFERDFAMKQARLQATGQMWSAELQRLGMEQQEQWNALNFIGQLMSMAGAEGWDEKFDFNRAFDKGQGGFFDILAGGGSVKEAGAYMLETISPHIT